jgi:hypothetical protein
VVTAWKPAEADYNLRQLRLAASALDGFLGGEQRVRDLGHLVGTLDGIKAALESPDDDWLDRLEDLLLTLESAYAVHLDRREPEIEADSARRVEEAVRTGQSMIASAIATLERRQATTR